MASKCLSVLLAPGTGKASLTFSLLAKLNSYSIVYILHSRICGVPLAKLLLSLSYITIISKGDHSLFAVLGHSDNGCLPFQSLSLSSLVVTGTNVAYISNCWKAVGERSSLLIFVTWNISLPAIWLFCPHTCLSVCFNLSSWKRVEYSTVYYNCCRYGKIIYSICRMVIKFLYCFTFVICILTAISFNFLKYSFFCKLHVLYITDAHLHSMCHTP
jgi:hypothetical protein